MELTLKAAC